MARASLVPRGGSRSESPKSTGAKARARATGNSGIVPSSSTRSLMYVTPSQNMRLRNHAGSRRSRGMRCPARGRQEYQIDHPFRRIFSATQTSSPDRRSWLWRDRRSENPPISITAWRYSSMLAPTNTGACVRSSSTSSSMRERYRFQSGGSSNFPAGRPERVSVEPDNPGPRREALDQCEDLIDPLGIGNRVVIQEGEPPAFAERDGGVPGERKARPREAMHPDMRMIRSQLHQRVFHRRIRGTVDNDGLDIVPQLRGQCCKTRGKIFRPIVRADKYA